MSNGRIVTFYNSNGDRKNTLGAVPSAGSITVVTMLSTYFLSV